MSDTSAVAVQLEGSAVRVTFCLQVAVAGPAFVNVRLPLLAKTKSPKVVPAPLPGCNSYNTKVSSLETTPSTIGL